MLLRIQISLDQGVECILEDRSNQRYRTKVGADAGGVLAIGAEVIQKWKAK
jgi:hypothetical protein